MTTGAFSPDAAPNKGATVVLNLGWQLTEIAYHGEPCTGRKPPDRPDLPTLSDLHRWEITGISVSTVEAEIHRLASSWADAGLEAPSAAPLQAAFLGGTKADLRQASQALHYQLLGLLHAADFTLGEAYDLGRALAYTTLKPHDSQTLREQFRFFRLETLQGWLADLATELPAHAARPVAISLDLWQRAIPDAAPASDTAGTVGSQSLASPASKAGSSAAQGNPAMPSRLRSLLHRQGKLWRELLTGEKDGQDMLAAQDCVAAGIELIGDAGGLIRGFFSKPAVTASAFVLVVFPLGAVVALLAADHQAASKVTGSVLAVAATLGVSWTSLRATLGKALAKAEQPLWQAELDIAIAEAITVLPSNRASLRQLFDFLGVGSAAPVQRATASEVAVERLPRGPDAPEP